MSSIKSPHGEEGVGGAAGNAARAARGGPYGPELLYQIIEVIGSGPDLGTILNRLVPVVTAATECHACFVYLLEGAKLVLRAASAGYSHMEGRVLFGPEEGLTGWVARTRHSAFIRDKALEDPRVVYVPELEEEQYQSLVSVPILARDGTTLGVITLEARAPHEFRQQDLDFLEHAASLIAGAIENARLYEEAVSQVDQLTRLSELAQRIASATGTGDLLETVTQGCAALLSATRCEIYLTTSDEQLDLATGTTGAAPHLDAKHLWSQVVAADGVEEAERALADLVWPSGHSGSPLFGTLGTGSVRSGLICVLVDQPSRDRRSLLASLAAYMGVAVQRLQLIDSLEEKNLVKDFFEAIAGGTADPRALRDQAARLQVDLDVAYLVMEAVPWQTSSRAVERSKTPKEPQVLWRDLAERLPSRLRVELPRSIFDDRENLLRGLLRVPPAGAEAAVAAVRHVYAGLPVGEQSSLAIGLSNPCQGVPAMARGFEEAASTAQVGSLLRSAAGVFAYEELGAYRYVVNAEGSVRDRYQDRLQKLVEYQRRRGTDLLRTLEAYVEHHGSIARTASALYMHPNTLRQRLARIEQLASLELEQEDWLSLGMAIKLIKLRQIRGSQNPPLPDR